VDDHQPECPPRLGNRNDDIRHRNPAQLQTDTQCFSATDTFWWCSLGAATESCLMSNRLCLALAGLVLFSVLSGCVRVQIKPKEIVSDTVSAGKSLYQTIKHKRDGTEERLYSHSVPLEADSSLVDVAGSCLDFLKTTAEEATQNKPEFLEENTEIINLEDGRKLTCKLRAVV